MSKGKKLKQNWNARSSSRASPAMASVLAACLALSGCASPYVRSVPDAAAMRNEDAASLNQAVARLRALHEAYRVKTIELGDFERLSLNSLIVLTGAIVGVAGVGGHANTIRNAAVVGGTGYTLGLVNSDHRRAMVYVAGMRGLECANEAITPLILHEVTLKGLKEGVAGIEARTKEASDAAGKVRAALIQVRANVPDADDAISIAADAVHAAAQAIDEAAATQSAADDLLAKHALAGEQLQVAVARIDAAVLDAVRGTEVSLQMLPRIIGGLRDNITLFSNVGTPPAGASPGDKQLKGLLGFRGSEGEKPLKGAARQRTQQAQGFLDQLSDAVSALVTKTATLNAASRRLERSVTSITARFDAKPDIKCAVDAPVMTLAPESLTFVEQIAETQTVELRGGKAPYYEPKVVPSAPGMTPTFVINEAKLALLTVTTNANVAKGEYKVVVVDGAGDVRVLPVRITGAPAPQKIS